MSSLETESVAEVANLCFPLFTIFILDILKAVTLILDILNGYIVCVSSVGRPGPIDKLKVVQPNGYII